MSTSLRMAKKVCRRALAPASLLSTLSTLSTYKKKVLYRKKSHARRGEYIPYIRWGWG